jgi:hypothetical protein
MTNSELDRLLEEASGHVGGVLGDFIKRAFDAGVRQERARLTALINMDVQQQRPPTESDDRHPANPQPDPSRQSTNTANYGKAIGAVRSALQAMPILPGGYDAKAIRAQIIRTSPEASGITETQVRTALKQLLTREELERVERGRFRLRRPSPGAEGPGDNAPGRFDFAAE